MNPLSKISSRISEMSKRGKITFAALILIAVVLLYYFLVFAPLTRALAEATEELEKKKGDLASQGRLIESVPRRQEDKEKLTGIFSEVRKKFLIEEQIPEFLKQLEKRTNKLGLDSSPPNPQRLLEQEGYNEQPIRIDGIKSDYHTLARFLNELENLPTLVNVNTVTISPGHGVSSRGVGEFPLEGPPGLGGTPPPAPAPAPSLETGSGELSSSVSLSVYILSPKEETEGIDK